MSWDDVPAEPPPRNKLSQHLALRNNCSRLFFLANAQFGQGTQWGQLVSALGSFVRRGSTGGRGSRVPGAELVRLASELRLADGRPGGGLCQRRQVLLMWPPRGRRGLPHMATALQGQAPRESRVVLFCPPLGATWCCFNHLLLLSAATMSAQRQGGDTQAMTQQKGEEAEI